MSNSRLKVRSWGPATCPQRVRCIVHGLPIIHSDLWHEQKAASFFLFAGPFDVRKFMAALCQFLQVASPARSFLFVRAGLSIVPLTNGRPPPPTPTARRSQFRIAFGACPYGRRILARNLGCQKGPVFLPPRVSVAVKATVEAFSRAYEKATPDKQAALRVWMRNIVLPGKIRRRDLDPVRRSEKESIEARDRRILEFLYAP